MHLDLDIALLPADLLLLEVIGEGDRYDALVAGLAADERLVLSQSDQIGDDGDKASTLSWTRTA